ncbi:site-specific integrase [Micromonospora humida]|uniref:site-specific integrase n=1 Tax=Micromonospora humida TaxID=2809018 RepID=UPI00366A7917
MAVWTANQRAEFLSAVNDDPLFALWWLAGLRGLRRGELCGLRWSDIDLDRGTLTIERNRTTAGYQIVEGEPKTRAGWRSVALDKRSVQILRAHRRHEQDRKAEAADNGLPWTDSGYVLTRRDGKPINPNYTTTRFRILIRRAGLPPVRLHDLRHGAASLAHEAGANLKTLQDLLGHSSIVVTADTYTSVLPQIQRRCADATARPTGPQRRPPHPQRAQSQRPQEPAPPPAPRRRRRRSQRWVLLPGRSASRLQSRRSRPDKPATRSPPGLHPHRTDVTPTIHAGQTARRA